MGRIAAGALLLLLLGSWAPGAAALGQPHAQRNLLLGLPPQVSSTLAGARRRGESPMAPPPTAAARGGAYQPCQGARLSTRSNCPRPAPAQCTSGSGLGIEILCAEASLLCPGRILVTSELHARLVLTERGLGR